MYKAAVHSVKNKTTNTSQGVYNNVSIKHNKRFKGCCSNYLNNKYRDLTLVTNFKYSKEPDILK